MLQISSSLERYDVTTKQTADIIKLPQTWISSAQISADGQWVIFVSEVNGSSEIQMVRVDGQGLQTLYCMPSPQYSALPIFSCHLIKNNSLFPPCRREPFTS